MLCGVSYFALLRCGFVECLFVAIWVWGVALFVCCVVYLFCLWFDLVFWVACWLCLLVDLQGLCFDLFFACWVLLFVCLTCNFADFLCVVFWRVWSCCLGLKTCLNCWGVVLFNWFAYLFVSLFICFNYFGGLFLCVGVIGWFDWLGWVFTDCCLCLVKFGYCFGFD